MSITAPVLPDSRIYGSTPNIKLTDVVSIDNDRVDPRTPNTSVDDSAIPLSVTMAGMEDSGVKKIKLINNIGATILTIAGTIILDSGLTEVELVYNSTYGIWQAVTPAAMIPATQKRAFIISSGAVISAKNIGFVDQGNKNSLALSLNGQVLITGGPGFGVLAADAGTGVLWIYERDGFDWVETHFVKSNALSGQIYLGKAAATNKDGTIAAGSAPDYKFAADAPPNNGAVVVFEKQPDNTYKEITPIVDTDPAIIPPVPGIPGYDADPYDQVIIGECIKMSGDGNTMVIGMAVGIGTDFPTPGYVWIYTRDPVTSKWSLLQVLDSRTFIGDLFGFAVDISADSNTIVVSVPLYDAPAFNSTGPGGVKTFNKAIVSSAQVSTVTISGVTAAVDGKYFVFEGDSNVGIDPAQQFFYVWYDNTGATVDPNISGAIGVRVDLTGVGDTDDNGVATATANAINAHPTADDYVTASAAANVVTITNKGSGSVSSTVDGLTFDGFTYTFSTGFTFATTNIGANVGQYTKSADDVVGSGSDDTEQLGGDVAINANGTIMVASSSDYVRFYSRAATTDNWTADDTILEIYPGIRNLDMNSAGNVVIAGNPDYNSSNGAIFIMVNYGSGWLLKSGPTTYSDVLNPAVTAGGIGNPQFGSDTVISGSGNNAIVGGVAMRDATLGVGFVYDVNTAGVAPASSSYFMIRSPSFFQRRYVVWYKTTTGSMPPNPSAEIGFLNPAIFWRAVSVDVTGLNLPAQNNSLALATAEAINGDPEFAAVATAKADGESIIITSTFSGTLGQVEDTTVTPTNFTFTETTAGEAPPLTGAFWPFA